MSKIMLGASFATGYVLGARAGRERYDQLQGQAQRLWGNPTVQEQASKVTSAVEDAVPTGSDSGPGTDSGSESATGTSGADTSGGITGSTAGAHAGSPSESASESTGSSGSRRSRGRRSRRGPRPQPPSAPSVTGGADNVALHDEDPIVYTTGPDVTATAQELAKGDEPRV